MTAQFTPGPWAIVGQDDHCDTDRADDCVMITGCAAPDLYRTLDNVLAANDAVTWWQEQASVRIFSADDLAQFQRAAALAASCVVEARAILDAVDTTTRRDSGATTEEAL
jgi:hypothetical protein